MKYNDFPSYDVCDLGFACPVRAGQKQSMSLELQIPDLEPEKSDTMVFYLFDGKTYDHLVCVMFPFELE